MSADHFIAIISGVLVTLMIGCLLLVAIALFVESLWPSIALVWRTIILWWRAWRGRDPDDKEHA